MNLHELQQAVFHSQPDDWHVMSCTTDSPSYLEAFNQVIAGKDPHWLKVASHNYRATYCPDVSIGLAWGLSWREKRTLGWSESFTDKNCTLTLVDLMWNGSLVDRYHGVYVDGARAVLPLPTGDYIGALTDPLQIAEQVAEDEVDLWRLIDTMEGRREFDHYLTLAGFTVVPEIEP